MRGARESFMKVFSGSTSKHWTKTGAVGLSRPFFLSISASRPSMGRPRAAKWLACFSSG